MSNTSSTLRPKVRAPPLPVAQAATAASTPTLGLALAHAAPTCAPRVAAEPSPEERFANAGAAFCEPGQAGMFDGGGGVLPVLLPVLDNGAQREQFYANANTGASQADPDAQTAWSICERG